MTSNEIKKLARKIFHEVINEYRRKHQDFYLARIDLQGLWLNIAKVILTLIHEREIEARIEILKWASKNLEELTDFDDKKIQYYQEQLQAELERVRDGKNGK